MSECDRRQLANMDLNGLYIAVQGMQRANKS